MSYKKALKLDQDDSKAYLGLSQCNLRMERNTKAVETALKSLGLKYYDPRGHFLLGIALHRIGRVQQAAEALKVAIAQNPLYTDAHERLAYILEKRLKDKAAADRHRQLAKEARTKIEALRRGDLTFETDQAVGASRTSDQIVDSSSKDIVSGEPPDLAKTVVIVTGLPRSGTSMMMQMLKAGGIPPLTDNVREADEDNPKGYYEYEKAKQLDKDSSWLPEAKGKAVKVVAQLLAYLPRMQGIGYRVIFMERNIEEVLASQKSMLKRQDRQGAKLSDEHLRAVSVRQVRQTEEMLSTRGIPTLFIDYSKTIKNPGETAERLKAFLGSGLDEEKMLEAVVPSLKRQDALKD